MSTLFVAPPPCKPSEPPLSGAAAARLVRSFGGTASFIDASIGWHKHALDPDRLALILDDDASRALDQGTRTAFKAAVRALRERPTPLTRPATYADRRVYTSAANDLDNALRLASLPFEGVRLGVAMIAYENPSRRLESSAVLEEVASRPGPFDHYLTEVLIPRIEASRATRVAVSLTFLQQAVAALRLAHLLRDRLPSVRRILGGPLVACWLAAGIDVDRAPFTLFHEVVAGDDDQLARLAGVVREASDGKPSEILAPALDDCPWEDYLSPRPVVPAAIGRGCYWRRCTFCPDHLHQEHRACGTETLSPWLESLGRRFPSGAMMHLTDSALPPEHLAEVAQRVISSRLPLQWHGFVRVERAFADPEFARTLARGGCSMLQFGVETASLRLHERLGKGAGPARARQVLRATAEAGIRNHVYLLFGLPGETDEDREQTLAFVEEEADSIAAINSSLLNLPKGSPMHREPERFGITAIEPFHTDTDLSLYDDFRCGASHPRLEARKWIERRFLRSARVKAILGKLRTPFKANHLCFL